jgi:prefoldin alpha subunit
MNEEEKKRAIAEYANLQIRLEAFAKERDEIFEKIEEIENTISSVEEVKENLDSLFPIGNGVYCEGKVNEEKFLVNIGAGILLKLDKKNTIEILRKRIEILKKAIEEINEQMSNIISQQERIANLINKGE